MTMFATALHRISTLTMLCTLYWIYAAGHLAVRLFGPAARPCGASAVGEIFPEWITPHTKMYTKPKLEYTFSCHTKRTPKNPSDLFRVECPQSTYSADWGHTRHVNQFHHVISQSCVKIGPLTFSRSTKLAAIGRAE